MSDKPLSDGDAIRQQLRATNDKGRQESQRRAEDVQLQNTVEKTINDLFRAVADARSHSENASWRGQPFDPRPHVPLIAAQLREVLNVLQQARRLGLLDDIDLDATCKHYCGQMDFQRYPKDDCRKALDLAVMNLRAAASDRADFDQLVTEVFFDSSVEPAGKWFQMLLSMVGGKLRFERKMKPVDPAVLQVGVRQGERDGADSSGDQGGGAEEGEQRAREPGIAPPAAVEMPPPATGTASMTASPPHPDGPEGGRWLWWKNKRYNIPQGIVYRLIEFMWDRDAASYDALEDAQVVGSVAPQTIRSYANKSNNALPPGFPWRLSTDSVNRQLTKVATAQDT
jgi:hypothetical protein